MSSPLFRSLIFAVVISAALWLRTADLSRRPMHADEANQAVKLGELIENHHYAFDPRDHHGPTLYYAALPIAWLRGEKTLAKLSDTTVRLVPAIAGTLAVLLLAALVSGAQNDKPKQCNEGWNLASGRVPSMLAGGKAPRGQVPPQSGQSFTLSFLSGAGYWPAMTAAGLLAVSPPAVYYSRYFIQETLLATFTLSALVCTERWWRNGHLAWAIAAGGCAGLMQATKASAPLFAGAAIIALLTARARRPTATRPERDLAFAGGTALGVAALFYSSFGLNLAGLRDAFTVYGPAWQRASEGAGHEKTWWYYLQLFVWQQNGGLIWQQLVFSALAVAGGILAFIRGSVFYRWAALYTLVVVVVLSLTPYKTPWHAVHLVPGLAILAAGAVASLPRCWLAGTIAATALVTQLVQTRLAVFDRPADLRNPYAYVHSVPDVLKFRPLVDAALAATPDGIVRVIGEEYWPLPWYLRDVPRVGYWAEPFGDCDGAVVIATTGQAEAVRARLHGSYREDYLGLRPGVLCVIFTRRP